MDENVEELCFPTIYCGQKRQPTIKLSYNDIIKSELRRYDRRCAKIPNLFIILRKKESIILNNSVNIYLRKPCDQKSLNVEKALDKQFNQQKINIDKAYKVLAQDRTSPSYWQGRMKDLMAMIRQLGIPTFFLTLSSAETHWNELLVILAKILDQRVITETEASDLSYTEKCDLIRRDPITCARYFDRRFRELFKLLQSDCGPFENYRLVDFHIRVEFQQRGSGHIHSLLWLENAPVFDSSVPNSFKECEEFITRFISCDTSDESLKHLYRYQYHKHSKSCKKFNENECRFGIPFYPMNETSILEPLDLDEYSFEELDKIDMNLEKIDTFIKEIDENFIRNNNDFQLDFHSFLQQLEMTYADYIDAICSTLKRPKVFLKREPHEIRTNGFNKEILLRYRANIDIQFVLDPYACVHYILNYINKSNKGMSILMKQVIEECNNGYMTHQQKLYKICSKFMNCSEVSSQEAVFILLSMPLSISSGSIIFISTGEKEKRTRLLKSEKELRELDPESNDVMTSGL